MSLLCWLGQHTDVFCTDKHRLYLRCTSCLRETPGWQVKEEYEPERLNKILRYARRKREA